MNHLSADDLCYPQLLNMSCRGLIRPRSEAVLIYTLLSSISVLTVALNLLVIISISYFKELQTPTNTLLLSLAISDLLVGLLVMPVETVRYVEPCWLLGDLMCALSYIVGFTLTSASVGNMVMISIDRYVAICYPLQYPSKVTRSRVQVSVILCWFCSLLYNGLILKEHLRQPDRYNSCYGECLVVISYICGTIDLVITFIVPCSVIVLLYVRVFVVAVSQARATQSHVTPAVGLGKITAQKSERKAARTLGVVILVFLLAFCPYYYPSLAGRDISNNSSSWAIVSWMLYFNSCLNPLIYAFFYPWFRKTTHLIVTLKILKQDSSQINIF
ncbi:trace amine-associated receptor 13c [Nothobranchius furzeri]|uniref:G-protein coupled receptors family 1 profile domain-containing protein n=1 Tax=Nothobranchius furzeri TaxID=105023 RepID=A0A1A8VFE3_NOTFU|nr:trace amine-associated receptor 13c [Nothobranchius furzeri]